MQSNPFPGKTGRWAFFSFTLCAELKGKAMDSALCPLTAAAFLLQSCGTYTCKSSWLSELWMVDLKRGALVVCSKPFVTQGKAGSWTFPHDCMMCMVGVYGERVSQPFPLISILVFSWWSSVQESLNWILNFSQRKLFHVQLYIWWVCGRRDIQEPPMLPFWGFLLYNFYNNNEITFIISIKMPNKCYYVNSSMDFKRKPKYFSKST